MTIFRTLSLDRKVVQWESYLDDLTPIHEGERITYKRDDLWAPLGMGGVNGFKVRQGVWLMSTVAARNKGLVFGGSVKSTQHAMVATVARHFGKQSIHVLGATTPRTYLRHNTVAIAHAQGAKFDFAPVAYTVALQKRVGELLALPEHADYCKVEYGVGLDHRTWPAEMVRAYHLVGAEQAANLPSRLDDLVVPAGSCHAATSFLLGLERFKRTPTVHLVGIGPTRIEWMTERLKVLGFTLEHRATNWHTHELVCRRGEWAVPVMFYDLIGEGYITYQKPVYESWDGIRFHPTYEAKVVRWLKDRNLRLHSRATTMWIVGAEPNREYMAEWAVDAISPVSMKSAI